MEIYELISSCPTGLAGEFFIQHLSNFVAV